VIEPLPPRRRFGLHPLLEVEATARRKGRTPTSAEPERRSTDYQYVPTHSVGEPKK